MRFVKFVKLNVGAKLLCAMASLVMMLAAPGWAAISDADFVQLCQKGTAAEVRAALDAGANANASGKVTVDIGGHSQEIGATALMAASFKNSPEVINVLLNAGADVNAKAERGMTALMAAAVLNKNPEVINVLLNAGADVNAKDEDGRTALMRAAMGKFNPEVIDILLKAGADINAKDKYNRTAGERVLGSAVSNYKGLDLDIEIIDVLLKAGSKVNEGTVISARRNENLKGTDTLRRLEEAGGFSEDDIAASSIISDLRILKTCALMFWADSMDVITAPGFNLADVAGTPEKLKATLGRYPDDPDRLFGGGLFVLEEGEGGKNWFVGFKLDSCSGAIREKLAGRARSTGLLRSRRPDDPYDGKADIVYMVAR